MTLQEKFEQAPEVYNANFEIVKGYEKIADEYAIGFAEWIFNQNPISLTKKSGLDNSYMRKSAKELLETYKKEKGL